MVAGNSGNPVNPPAPPTPAPSTANHDIGDAAVLATGASSTLSSRTIDDWWVMYPAAPGGSVSLTVTNNSPNSASCSTVFTEMYNLQGAQSSGVINGYTGQSTGTTRTYNLSGSTRYYAEVSLNGCQPGASQSSSYSLSVSGAGGAPSAPAAGSVVPGTSIGTVGAALQGATIYHGSLDSKSADDWYVLDKSGTSTATVRIANETVAGSSNCSTVFTEIYNDGGAQSSGVVDGYAGQPNNSANTYTFTTAGRYYIEVNLNGCNPGSGSAATYDIEPEPAGGWG